MTPRKFFVGRAIGFGVVVLVALIVWGFYALNSYIYQEKQGEGGFQNGYKDTAYTIEGQPITLVNGVSEVDAAPDSASKIVTTYFGNEAEGDLNGDDISDIAFILTQTRGGSGTFYYVVAAIKTDTGYKGTEAVLLGDRIAPQPTEIRNGILIANYADRKPGEPLTAPPSVGKSLHLKLDPGTLQFGEVVQDFEGEADPSRMTLDMKKWNWISALYNDGREITPKQQNKFTLTFTKDGRFSATTDCNSMSGSYTATKDTISFGPIASTKMFCEGSQESEFASMLTTTSGYHFTSKGELILDLKFDSGSVVFR